MKKQFISAMAAMCILYHVRDPETEKMGWLIKCMDDKTQSYISPNFVNKLPKAKSIAKKWLLERPPKYTVSVEELRLRK